MWIVQAGRGPVIVDNVDNLKTNCPQYPQLSGEKAGKTKGRGQFVDKVDNVDNPYLVAGL